MNRGKPQTYTEVYFIVYTAWSVQVQESVFKLGGFKVKYWISSPTCFSFFLYSIVILGSGGCGGEEGWGFTSLITCMTLH